MMVADHPILSAGGVCFNVAGVFSSNLGWRNGQLVTLWLKAIQWNVEAFTAFISSMVANRSLSTLLSMNL